MSYGLPVIAFKNAGPNEILGDKNVGKLVEKFDVKQFATKIVDTLNNYDEYQKMSLMAKERSKDFSINKIVKEWEGFFKNE